jgi:hypothetical protein
MSASWRQRKKHAEVRRAKEKRHRPVERRQIKINVIPQKRLFSSPNLISPNWWTFNNCSQNAKTAITRNFTSELCQLCHMPYPSSLSPHELTTMPA